MKSSSGKWLRSLLLAIVTFFATCEPALADEYVQGYIRSDGTYVAPYWRSSPDNSYNNNWSVKGNTNPYTGEEGTKSPTWNDKTPYQNEKEYGNPGYESSGSSDSEDSDSSASEGSDGE